MKKQLAVSCWLLGKDLSFAPLILIKCVAAAVLEKKLGVRKKSGARIQNKIKMLIMHMGLFHDGELTAKIAA